MTLTATGGPTDTEQDRMTRAHGATARVRWDKNPLLRKPEDFSGRIRQPEVPATKKTAQ